MAARLECVRDKERECVCERERGVHQDLPAKWAAAGIVATENRESMRVRIENERENLKIVKTAGDGLFGSSENRRSPSRVRERWRG